MYIKKFQMVFFLKEFTNYINVGPLVYKSIYLWGKTLMLSLSIKFLKYMSLNLRLALVSFYFPFYHCFSKKQTTNRRKLLAIYINLILLINFQLKLPASESFSSERVLFFSCSSKF